MRGKLQRDGERHHRRRTIPASAGQTINVFPNLFCNVGSSPRVRGKLPCKQRQGTGFRIIPASAGQTRSCRYRSCVCADHPRECGANAPIMASSVSFAGSSPRVRGKHRRGRCRAHVFRIIPASAGQTLSIARRGSSMPDHPRECGANSVCRLIQTRKTGSSPRVRGKRQKIQVIGKTVRIIPASAGQTPCDTHG